MGLKRSLLMQAAVYVVMKFPARGTMLDLVNALAHQLVCRAPCQYAFAPVSE